MNPVNSTPADTTPEIDRLYRSLLMQRSGEERMRMGAAMFDAAKALVTARVRTETRNLNKGELRAAVFTRTYAVDLDDQTRARVSERIRHLWE
jgi:hypothetical protein